MGYINDSVLKCFKKELEELECKPDKFSKVKATFLKNHVIPTIEGCRRTDVAEVKHGYNKTSMHPVDEFLCSECGFCCADYTETKYDEDGDYTYSCECEFDYCPRCGVKMDGKKE